MTRHVDKQATWIPAAAIGIVDAAADVTAGIAAPRCVLYGLGTVAQTDVANWSWIVYGLCTQVAKSRIYIHIQGWRGETREKETKNEICS